MQQKSCNQVITARQDRLLPMPSSTARWRSSVADEDEVNGRSSEGRPCNAYDSFSCMYHFWHSKRGALVSLIGSIDRRMAKKG